MTSTEPAMCWKPCGRRSIHIALDDFGSGYSALTYLRKLPIDEVKLDQDLIIHVLTDPRAEAIVRAVIELGSLA